MHSTTEDKLRHVGFSAILGESMNDNRPCPSCGSTDASIRFREPPFRVLRCDRCRLVYLGNPPDEGEIYERYYESPNADAAEYRSDSGNPALAELFAINNQRMELISRPKPSGTLLDIGCGRGYFLKTAQEHGFTVTGIDISERAVAYATQAFGLTANVSTVDHLAASGKQYDVVTLWHVLEHFPDPFTSLKQVRSLLHPDGLCALEVPNLHSLKFVTARHKWQGGNHPLYHRTFFTERTLRRSLLDAGFSDVVRVKQSYHIPGRNRLYEGLKGALNIIACDAFLTFVARSRP